MNREMSVNDSKKAEKQMRTPKKRTKGHNTLSTVRLDSMNDLQSLLSKQKEFRCNDVTYIVGFDINTTKPTTDHADRVPIEDRTAEFNCADPFEFFKPQRARTGNFVISMTP